MLHCERFDLATLKKEKNLCALSPWVMHNIALQIMSKLKRSTYKNKDIIYIRQKKSSQPSTAFSSVRFTQKCKSKKNSMEKDLMQFSI